MNHLPKPGAAFAPEFLHHVAGTYSLPADSPSAVRFFNPEGGLLFAIEWDGALTLGLMTDLDTISRQFWAHLRDANPLRAEVARLQARLAELEALTP